MTWRVRKIRFSMINIGFKCRGQINIYLLKGEGSKRAAAFTAITFNLNVQDFQC